MGVVPPSPDVPSPGASTKHNGQPLAEPGEGAEEAKRGVRRPIAACKCACENGVGGGGGSWGSERYRGGRYGERAGVDHASVVFALPQSLSLMPRPVVLPCFHPLPPPPPSHMGRRRRQHDWGRWEEDRLRGITRAHPVQILRGWVRELTAAVSGFRRCGKIVDAACVLYAVCMLFLGALDLPAFMVGAFEYFVSVGATRPAASISFTGVGLAMAPGAVRAALRWRYGAAASQAWRAPRRRFLAGAVRQVVYNIISPLWDAGPFDLRGVRQWVPDQWWPLPQCRLVVLVGWCPGLLAGSAGHAVGLSYTGWLVCAQHGTVYVTGPGWGVGAHPAVAAERMGGLVLLHAAARVVADAAHGCAAGCGGKMLGGGSGL